MHFRLLFFGRVAVDGSGAPAGKTKNEMRAEYKMIVGNKKTKGKHQKGGASDWADDAML